MKPEETPMNLKPLIMAGAVVFAGTTFAQAASPGASYNTPGHKMQRLGPKAGSPGASGYAPGHQMQQRNTGMSNSTGNMNTKGTGRGTTGTGGRGGSGNR
jgi:hypothetical protein